MEGEERNIKETGGEKNELVFLYSLDKDAIIKKCLEFKSALYKAQDEIKIYRSLLQKSARQFDLLKSTVPDIKTAEYDKRWSWLNKIVFVLKKIDRPLLSSEILSFILPYEPVLQHSRHKAQAFSANLTKAVKYGRVKAYKLAGSRGYYYILSAWLNDEGRLSKAYEDKIFFK